MGALFFRHIVFISFACLVGTGFASAKPHARPDRYQGFVRISQDRSLFVDFLKPQPGKPIAVLLNGLTYRTASWDKFVAALSADGLGILRYDMMGQGGTLLLKGPAIAPFALRDQVSDFAKLLNALNIQQPVHLVSLSYGAAIGISYAAQHPEMVASQILMAPFIAPLEGQDIWIKLQIQNTRVVNPANPMTDDELYDYFLHVLVYQTYPSAEPVVLEHPYKLEATYRMVQGARKFLAKDYVNRMPAGTVHVVLARRDQYVPNSAHEEFWKQVPKRARGSLLYVEGSEHKLPEAVPAFVASWSRHVIENDTRIRGGKVFEGTPRTSQAKSGSTVIDLGN